MQDNLCLEDLSYGNHIIYTNFGAACEWVQSINNQHQ